MFSPAQHKKEQNSPWEDPFSDSGMAQYYREKRANDIQHGGTHYKQFKGHEPWDVVQAWDLGYLDGTALKYISRWRHKNGVEDLKKAIHFLEKLIEVENAKRQPG